MRIALIYTGEQTPALSQLLGECGELTLIEFSQAQQATLDRWDAIFLEMPPDEEDLQPILTKLVGKPTMLFSFSRQADAHFTERSARLAFIAHLDDCATLQDLRLHLHYGRRLALAERLANGGQFDYVISSLTDIHYSLETNQVINTALEKLPRLIPGDSFAIFLSSEDGEMLELVGNHNDNAPALPPLQLNGNENKGKLLTRAATGGKPILINDLAGEEINDERAQAGNFHAVMYLPLHTRARLFGLLEIAICQPDKQFTITDMELAERLAASLAVALANANRYANVERLGQIDDLTQLYNSRYLYQALEVELKRSRRYKFPVSVIFLDLDGFKQVNDINGHLCGSATLTEVANLMIGLVRETDIVARYGGDEFVIVLPETPAERAVTIAERIRQQIEAHIFRGGGDGEICLTASFGVASYPEHASSPAALIRSADKAMYVAKECKKNQVVLAN